MKYMLKIICRTPKGKSEDCSKSFGMKYFDLMNKPVETKILSDEKFEYIFSFDSAKKRYKMMEKKIPMAETKIRNYYTIIMYFFDRGEKIAKKAQWTVDKIKRWIMKQLRRKYGDIQARDMQEYIDNADLSDKEIMLLFLAEPIFSTEEWEDEE